MFAGTQKFIAFTVALVPFTVHAQVVRGTVTDRASGAAGSGAIVRLEKYADTSIVERSVLTDLDGAYSIVSWGPGSYRVSVKRIGRLPYRSEAIELKEGEVRVLNVQLDLIPATGLGAVMLHAVRVRQATPCDANTTDGMRIATLWDDARTALEATEITARDQLVARRLVRFVREIELPTLNVLSEAIKAFDQNDVPNQAVFRSISADSLARVGYWRARPGTAVEFHGIDANALLSEAFVRDHCFRLDQSQVTKGVVGLKFEPVKARTKRNSPPDVMGTIWLDAITSDLQTVDFVWTKLRGDLRHIGGQVVFARHATGPWYVSSWMLRMPRELVLEGSFGTARGMGLVEEGGLVLEDSIDTSRPTGTITGAVKDGDGRPMEGAVVRIIGTEVRAMTGPDGKYELRGVPAGLQFVVADHDTLSEMGVRIGQTQVLLDEGVSREVSFTGPTPNEVTVALCNEPSPRNHATLRLMILDSTTMRPLAGLRVRVASKDPSKRGAFDSSDETDASGAVVFCAVPAGQPLIVTNPATGGRVMMEVTVRRGAVMGRVIRANLEQSTGGRPR